MEVQTKDTQGKRLRMGIIGAGNWGQNLVRNFSSLPLVDLAYIADVNANVRNKMKALYSSASIVESGDAIFNDPAVNAVVIALESPLHYKFAKKSLEAGKHTYVEKPLTLSVTDAQDLVTLSKKKNLKLMLGHLLEYHPAVNYIKDLISTKKIGDPLYLYFHRLNLGIVRNNENAWWSLAPHDISVACYLFGIEPISVTASGNSYLQKGIEDVVFATLKFPGGLMAHIHVSWLDPHKTRKVTLVGSEKMVVFDDMEATEKIRIFDKGAAVKNVNNYTDTVFLRVGDILIPKISSEEPLKLECAHFVDAIIKNQPVRSDGEDGLRVVKVLEAGSRSLAEEGRPVTL